MKGLVSKVFARTAVAALTGFFIAASTPAVAAGGRRCEKKVDGKWTHLEDVKNRKECKKKGGKWVKADHDHSHGEGEHDHEHDEDEE